MDDTPQANWDCPNCKSRNEENYEPNESPSCANCDEQFEWEEVLDPEELHMLDEQLKTIDEQDHKRGLYGDN